MLNNFLGYHRLWIWKTSHFASHNLWLQKCSYSTYLGNKWIFILRDKINTAIFLSVEHFLPSVSCLHNFLGGRKMKTSCWENQGRVVLFISEMALAHGAPAHTGPEPWIAEPFASRHRAAAPRKVPAGGCQSQVSAAPSQALVRFAGWDERGAEGSNMTSPSLGHSGAISACKKQVWYHLPPQGCILSQGNRDCVLCASSVCSCCSMTVLLV